MASRRVPDVQFATVDGSLTLALDGEVTLKTFDTALSALRQLLGAVGRNVTKPPRPRIEWVIDDLNRSSATTAVRPVIRDEGNAELLGQIVVVVNDVGLALEENTLDEITPSVARPARKLADLVDGGVERLRLVTELGEHYVERPPAAALAPGVPTVAPRSALGEVRGRLQTLSNRGGLRFTIYDLLHDKAVTGFLEPGNEDLLKDLWGRLVGVEGVVTRDASGRPTSVRRVRTVQPIAERPPGDYRRARGALQWTSKRRPEDVIRKLRDSG